LIARIPSIIHEISRVYFYGADIRGKSPELAIN
jgi:hypothetical protein